MAFPPGFLDELRSRVSLADLVGKRVRLVRKGREHGGLCPFHNEKTPSFYVVEDKGFFHCFGCGAHGDAIGFLMRSESLDFLEAVERLAGIAGIAVPQQTPQEREKAQRQKTLLEALAAAANFYEEQLWSPLGSRGREYLLKRGLDEETIRRFRLGWAGDDRSALRRALTPEIPQPLLIEAGLLHTSDFGGEPYDYFRERVIFPIGDRAGRVIAFGGRTIGDAQPKYLNSPEHPLFEKGRVLYGLSVARVGAAREIEAGRPGVIVTEGYMDVIALHQARFSTAVAPLGTALTEHQIQELWKLAPEPVLCFDGDAAGQRAAVRALRRALPLLKPGNSLTFATMPAGEDPDSLIQARGPLGFKEVLTTATPLAAKIWETEAVRLPLKSPEQKADLRRRLMEDIGLIADRSVNEQYYAYLINYKFRELTWGPKADRRKLRGLSDSQIKDRPEPILIPDRHHRELLCRILLQFPSLMDEVEEDFASYDFPEDDLREFRREIFNAQAMRPGLDGDSLHKHLRLNGFDAVVDELMSPSVHSDFIYRLSGSISPRDCWDHVIKMMTARIPTSPEDAIPDLTNEDAWIRYRERQGWDKPENLAGDEFSPTLH
jgi:DNA primase